ncbi:hypothetical protein RND81_04G240400 [Saponaria officinalis]|uniref:Uncharacterized protein n=1 Tax=Saponaria officinalis TaxID=3572 RepID=A0AAW1LRM0_SAPOF
MGITTKITKKKTLKSCIKLGLIIPLIFLSNKKIKLILHEGTTKVIKRRMKIKAGEIMFEFPDCVVCQANSFFIGKPIPILSIHDHLVAGHTYFIVPLDRLPSPPDGGSGGGALLSTTSLFSLGSPSGGCPNAKPPATLLNLLSSSSNRSSSNNNNKRSTSPFEYVKDKDGRVALIKVVPDFITRIITSNCSPNNNNNMDVSAKLICSTPELQKQYEQLVRGKDRAWSPKLETIIERKIGFSPSRLLRLEWK